ncbi:hypothetical protein [Nannocystis pusilla]|uniref:hypothetical protein n=1 Tax=Nannocystis pusilla TaxID=889268 RepID=UPI003B7F70C1
MSAITASTARSRCSCSTTPSLVIVVTWLRSTCTNTSPLSIAGWSANRLLSARTRSRRPSRSIVSVAGGGTGWRTIGSGLGPRSGGSGSPASRARIASFCA